MTLPSLVLALLTSTSATEIRICPYPLVEPVVEVGDFIYDFDKPPKPGEPAGDSICELYCAIRVRDTTEYIPQCAQYSCTFELLFPDGRDITRRLTYGQWVDGMSEPTETGTVCNPWLESYPPGWYRASLWCTADPSATAELRFYVAKSQPTGFDLPSSVWQGRNHCPRRPDFDVTPNPSLQRTPPG